MSVLVRTLLEFMAKILIYIDTSSQTKPKAPKRTACGKKKQSPPIHGTISGRVSKSKSASKSVTPKAPRKVPRTEDFIKSEAVDSGYDDYMDTDGFLGTPEEYEALRDLTSNDEMFSLHEYDNDEVDDLYAGL